MNPYWSYVLTAVGVFGLWAAGRKRAWGWAIGIGAQFLWIAYATFTEQWGFYLSALAYGWVYTKNFLAWRKEPKLTHVCEMPGGLLEFHRPISEEEAEEIKRRFQEGYKPGAAHFVEPISRHPHGRCGNPDCGGDW